MNLCDDLMSMMSDWRLERDQFFVVLAVVEFLYRKLHICICSESCSSMIPTS